MLGTDSPLTALHDLQIIFCLFLSIFISVSPSLLPNSLSNHFRLSHAITSPAFCPTSRSASPPPVSLIVLFSAEGYSCLQGYENVRKAHSIFSYVNSHFPPEQTHFSRSDLPCCTSHIPPLSLHYLSTIVGGKMNSAPSLLICHFDITDCFHRPLYSSPSSPFKQPQLTSETLSYINSTEIAPIPVVISLNTINTLKYCD